MSLGNNLTKPVVQTVNRPLSLTIISILMILFGIAEVVTSFTHQFLGLSTAQTTLSLVIGAFVGLMYIGAGLLTLTMKRWAAQLAIACLALDIVGRLAMVLAGLYPVDSAPQIFAIILGTGVAFLFAVYIGRKWSSFT